MTAVTFHKNTVAHQLRGLDKRKDVETLAETIIRSSPDDAAVMDRVHLANRVIDRIKPLCHSSSFAAAYAKLFPGEEPAMSARESIGQRFVSDHHLGADDAYKLADFCVHAAGDLGLDRVRRAEALAGAALSSGVDILVILDVLKSKQADIPFMEFAEACKAAGLRLHRHWDGDTAVLISKLMGAVYTL